jgi:hypothetical protein
MPALSLALALACQEPFDAARQDLVGDRVVAVALAVDAQSLRPTPALWVDGRGWTDTPVDLSWGWVDDPDAAVDFGPELAVATGPEPVIPRGGGTLLAFHARFPSGTVERGYLVPPVTAGERRVLGPWARSVLPVNLEGITGEALTREARAALTGSPGEIAPGGVGRLTLDAPDATVRFTASRGTILELDAETADWVAGDVLLDEADLELAEPIGVGWTTLVALTVAADRVDGWSSADLWVGPPEPGAWLGERVLPGADAPAPGRAWATLAADDDAPCGLRATAWFTADPATPKPPCIPPNADFHPDQLLDGTCTRAELVGATVPVSLTEAP